MVSSIDRDEKRTLGLKSCPNTRKAESFSVSRIYQAAPCSSRLILHLVLRESKGVRSSWAATSLKDDGPP